jgi:hypothetical protein
LLQLSCRTYALTPYGSKAMVNGVLTPYQAIWGKNYVGSYLQDELGRKGLSKSGVKVALLQRLVEQCRDLEAYKPIAWWKVLQPSATPCIKPERPRISEAPPYQKISKNLESLILTRPWTDPLLLQCQRL